MITRKDAHRLDEAMLVAVYSHHGQRRWGGEPYITHPLHVSFMLEDAGWGTSEILVGLVHDVLEDCDFAKLEGKVLVYQEGNFRCQVVLTDEEKDALIAITKVKGEKYADYIDRVMQSPLAMVVKMADINHNLKSMPPGPDEHPRRARYLNTVKRLADVFA